jgi:hypothetical protein
MRRPLPGFKFSDWAERLYQKMSIYLTAAPDADQAYRPLPEREHLTHLPELVSSTAMVVEEDHPILGYQERRIERCSKKASLFF